MESDQSVQSVIFTYKNYNNKIISPFSMADQATMSIADKLEDPLIPDGPTDPGRRKDFIR
jgi:hypothetical protein